jgi:RNA polymerase-binding transcription factor DksA
MMKERPHDREVRMERERIRRLLVDERDRAEAVAAAQRAVLLGSHDEIFDELSSVDQHQADSASDTYEREQALTVLRMTEEELAAIEAALEKLAAGTYGRCEACRDPIADERLEAVPATRFCALHERDAEFGRIGMRVGPLEAAVSEPVEPGWSELGLLPDDDELTPRRRRLSAEEAAMHLEVEEGGAEADQS